MLDGAKSSSGGRLRSSRSVLGSRYRKRRCSKSRSRKAYATPHLNFPSIDVQLSEKPGSPTERNGIVKSTAESLSHSLSVLKSRVPPSESLTNSPFTWVKKRVSGSSCQLFE